jgi:hypothetical protein
MESEELEKNQGLLGDLRSSRRVLQRPGILWYLRRPFHPIHLHTLQYLALPPTLRRHRHAYFPLAPPRVTQA